MDELRFCPQGCCRFINDRAVSNAEYDAVPRPIVGQFVVEALIPCRHITNKVQKATEDAAGFYLGAPLRRAFGTLIATAGKPIVFDALTEKRLREATDEDMKKWNDAWKQAVEAEIERKKH